MTDEDQLHSQETIEVMPRGSIVTSHDRDRAVMFKIPSSMQNKIDSATDRLVVAITEIFKSVTNVDHLEFFTWNLADGMVVAIVGYSPKVQNVTQPRIDGVADDQDLSEPLATIFNTLQSQLPDTLDPQIGPLPFGMFGVQPGVTSRAVMNHDNQKVTNRDKIDGVGLSALTRDLKNEPFLYSCIIRRPSKLPESFEFQVTPRVAVFNPRYRIASEVDYGQALEFGRELDPIDPFKPLGVSSTIERIDDHYYLYSEGRRVGVCPESNSPLGHFSNEKKLITGDQEYEYLLHGRYGASDRMERICSYTSLMVRQTDLALFAGIETASPDCDPWTKSNTGDARGPDTLATDISSLTPDSVSVPVTSSDESEFTQQTPSTANDGTERHFEAIKQVAVALENRGYEVIIVEQDTGSRPDLWARNDDGVIFAVEVEFTTKSKAGSFFTNLIRQALWGYKTIVVMVPQTNEDGRTQSLQSAGQWAVNKIAKPMKDIDEYKTKLHTLGKNIVKDGKTMLLPKGVDESEWWLTCENEYILFHEGDILARGDATEPFENFEFKTPRYYVENGTAIVEDHDGTELQTFDPDENIPYTRMSPCHRPVDLSYLHFVKAIYCCEPDDQEFVQHPITAKWDQPDHSSRNEESLEDAFTTFVVDRDDEKLWEHNCYPFIRDWIDQLSVHGSPAKHVYGKYRKEYHSKKSVNREVGKDHYYPNTSFRYQRGLVSPDLPGLHTNPTYPEDWTNDSDTIPRDPLIHGLTDRSEILKDTDD